MPNRYDLGYTVRGRHLSPIVFLEQFACQPHDFCRDSMSRRTKEISAVDPELCTLSHLVPLLRCCCAYFLKLATTGLVRHLAVLEYASIRG